MVLDTSAFLAGFDPFSINEDQITAPRVEDEISANSMAWVRFKAAVENGKVKIRKPSEKHCSIVKASAKEVGDAFFLSDTDLQILALASELKAEGCKPQIVTDDYSIQNVATQLGIGFVSLATFGISRFLHWIRYCPACRRRYPADYKLKTCEVCGTALKRKPKKNTKTSSTK